VSRLDEGKELFRVLNQTTAVGRRLALSREWREQTRSSTD
jgi:hypothetical protein